MEADTAHLFAFWAAETKLLDCLFQRGRTLLSQPELKQVWRGCVSPWNQPAGRLLVPALKGLCFLRDR